MKNSTKSYSIKINQDVYNIKVVILSSTEVSVIVRGKKFNFMLPQSYLNHPKFTVLANKKSTHVTVKQQQQQKTFFTNDESVVRSIMPGRVVTINVKEGDSIQEGQAVVTIESMKMENVITSKCSGIVKKINVTEGDNTQRGESLIEIEV